MTWSFGTSTATSSTVAPAPRSASAHASVLRRTSGSIGQDPSRSTDTASRRPSTPARRSGRMYRGRRVVMSDGSGPASTFSNSTVSATVRASGPQWQYGSRLNGGSTGTRPYGGLKPTTPLNDAGMRIEPPMSDPLASVVVPEASAAPEPPDEPPTEYSGFHGFRVTPHRRDCVKPAHENSGAVDRAWTIAPASRCRRPNADVCSAIRSL